MPELPETFARTRGFTLLEVMITVAIVGILAAIAVPSYSYFVTRSRIIEGTNALGDYRNRMEKYFLDHRTYLDAGGNCAMASDMATNYNVVPDHLFAMSCPASSATSYTLRAQGSGPMTGFTYTVNEQNAKATTATVWGPTAANCWVIRKDGSCT
jgi:type IV pilus assembly protein PilE